MEGMKGTHYLWIELRFDVLIERRNKAEQDEAHRQTKMRTLQKAFVLAWANNI